MEPSDACRRAGEILLSAGFVCRHISLKSEARYYGFPDRKGLLRVAAHAARGEVVEGELVIAKLTFTYGSPREEREKNLVLTKDQIEALTASAIGRFLIASGMRS